MPTIFLNSHDNYFGPASGAAKHAEYEPLWFVLLPAQPKPENSEFLWGQDHPMCLPGQEDVVVDGKTEFIHALGFHSTACAFSTPALT